MRLTALFCSAPASVMILNIAARRLGRGLRDPGQREHLAGLGRDGRDPAVAAGQRLDRGALELRGRSRLHVGAAHRGLAGEHAAAGVEHAAGRAGQALVELALEAGQADRRAGGDAALGELLAALRRAPGRRGPRSRTPSGPRSDRRSGPLAIAVPSRAWIVARSRQHRLALELLAVAQAGVDELGRASRRRGRRPSRSPVGSTRTPRSVAEDAGVERDRDAAVARPCRPGRRCERERVRRLLVACAARRSRLVRRRASSESSAYIARWSPRSQACGEGRHGAPLGRHVARADDDARPSSAISGGERRAGRSASRAGDDVTAGQRTGLYGARQVRSE